MAIISAAVAILAPAISFYLTKEKEREADWQRYRFEQYKDFIAALSANVGADATADTARRFAWACNTLQLLASPPVIRAMHDLQDGISTSNPNRSRAGHDELLSRLIWELRTDLKLPNTPDAPDFAARVYSSGRTMERSRGNESPQQ